MEETWGYVDLSKASIGLDFELGEHGAVVLNGEHPEHGERVIIAFLPAAKCFGWAHAERLKEEWMKRACLTLEPITAADSDAILSAMDA